MRKIDEVIKQFEEKIEYHKTQRLNTDADVTHINYHFAKEAAFRDALKIVAEVYKK